MELSLLVVFWYGILHAFGPDHLTAIADFSIGKDKRKTLMITTLFALGHGLSLFVFAKILQKFNISKELLAYGDIISAAVIMGMGAYLIFMVVSRRIHLHTHQHEGREHVHIWFGKKHDHKQVDTTSSFTVGLLMGIGGVRGMLVTLGAVQGGMVDFGMVGAFTLGVILIFISFGMLILYINQNFLNNLQNVRGTFATVGIISIMVGMNILSF